MIWSIIKNLSWHSLKMKQLLFGEILQYYWAIECNGGFINPEHNTPFLCHSIKSCEWFMCEIVQIPRVFIDISLCINNLIIFSVCCEYTFNFDGVKREWWIIEITVERCSIYPQGMSLLHFQQFSSCENQQIEFFFYSSGFSSICSGRLTGWCFS